MASACVHCNLASNPLSIPKIATTLSAGNAGMWVHTRAHGELTADAEYERQPALEDVQLPRSLRAAHI